ncbi:type II secretion system F family protein [Gracilibacillus caseinilyticus]|uniref:Type II secretion system F family protein n=1 Tax=Gracilibacillus caseinilyticus TaxID=2932256 RepID=A0ABY4ES79_9BACI|nr:type II secretion system F family protein [Gracilibacillus caseinilyticus]UOQ47290.1 type II secretion system F family protein [Gracilibacillus caseinilyticus]
MIYYQYRGRTVQGKFKKGKVKAESEKDVIRLMAAEGVTIFEVKPLDSVLYKDITIGKPVKLKEFVIFLRQLATLIESGIPIIDSIEILAEQTSNKAFALVLNAINEDLQEGNGLSEAMSQHSKFFPELLTRMVYAGEVSGNLDEILDNMASYYEKQYALRQKIKTALAYPLFVSIFAVVITLFLLVYIVPIFTNLFSSFGESLPIYTVIVLRISEVIQQIWWALLLLVVLIIVLWKIMMRSESFTFRIDEIKLRLPVIGSFLQKSQITRMSQTLSTLLNSSVPILQSVQITEKIVDNRLIAQVLHNSHHALERGQSMASAMQSHTVIPPMVIQMIAVGERTGSLDKMLFKIADFYEKELDDASDKLKALIEPILIVILAVIVGAIVLAIVIPMFSIFDAI